MIASEFDIRRTDGGGTRYAELWLLFRVEEVLQMGTELRNIRMRWLTPPEIPGSNSSLACAYANLTLTSGPFSR